MAMKAEDALNLARAYTKKSLAGAGALKGENGEDGKSAYEIAKDNGFVGTEEEWLESLKGDGGNPSSYIPTYTDANSIEVFEEALVGIFNTAEEGSNYHYVINNTFEHPVYGTGKLLLEGYKEDVSNGWERITVPFADGLKVYSTSIVNGSWTEWKEDKSECGSVEIVESVSHTSTNEQVLGAKAFYENYGRKFYDLGMWYVKKGMVNSTLDALLNSITSNDRPVVISGFVDEGMQSLFNSIKTSIFGSTSVDMAWGVLSITVDALGAMEITYTLTHRKGIYLNSSIDGRLAGWTKLDNEDVLSLKGGYMSNGAYVIFGSDGGSSTKITSDDIMVDDADNGKTTSITADSVDTPAIYINGKKIMQIDDESLHIEIPSKGFGGGVTIIDDKYKCFLSSESIQIRDENTGNVTDITASGIDTLSLKINGEDVSVGVQDVPTYNMNELTTPGIYFKIDGSYMYNAPSRYGTPDDTSGKPDHFAIIEVVAYSSNFMSKPVIIQKYYRLNYNEDCGNDCATRYHSNFGWGEWSYEADRDYVDSKQTTMDVLVDMHNLNDNNSVTLSKGISNYKMLMFCMYTEHNNMVGNKVSAGTNTIPVSAFNINDQMLFASTFMSDQVFYLTAMGMGDKELNIENLSDHDSTVIATYVTIYGIK